VGRISRSFELVGQSYRVLMQDKELMILPLVSGVFIIAVAIGFFVGFDLGPRIQAKDPSAWAPTFLLYVATYAIGIFFQAAVIAGATERLRGGNPTLGSALTAAARRTFTILMWAVLAATVGMVLRSVSEKAGFLGRIAVAIAGAAWSIATFFVVPVLVLEDASIPESFGRSLELFRKMWGESVVGSATLGIAGVCAWLTLVALAGLLAWAGFGPLALVALAVGGIILAVLMPALQGVFVASLYEFATNGTAPPGFDRDLLSEAFTPKRDGKSQVR
jgi:hypothetical protein